MDGITVNTPFGKREQVHSTERRDKNLGVTPAGHHRRGHHCGVTTAGSPPWDHHCGATTAGSPLRGHHCRSSAQAACLLHTRLTYFHDDPVPHI